MLSVQPFTSEDWAELRRIAIRYILWEKPEDAMADLEGLAVRVMNDAGVQDTKTFRRIVGDDFLRHVLTTSPAILYSPGSWGYWHKRLGVSLRPLPPRSEGIEPGILADY